MSRAPFLLVVCALAAVAWLSSALGVVDVAPPVAPAAASAVLAPAGPRPASASPKLETSTPDTALAADRHAPPASRRDPDERAILEGLVVAASGAPVARAWITSASGARARSDGHGRFRLFRRGGDGDPAQLLVTAAGFAPGRIDTRWGNRGCLVQLDVAGMLAIQVVDAATGRPVEGYRAQLVAVEPRGLRAGPVELKGSHEGGRLEARVELGSPVLLRVLAADDVYAPSALHVVELRRARPRTVRVSLPRWCARTVTVSDERGEPVLDAMVEALAAPPGLTVDRATRVASPWRDQDGSQASRLAIARTDASGRAALRVPSHGSFTLRASHPDAGVGVRRLDADGAADLALQLGR